MTLLPYLHLTLSGDSCDDSKQTYISLIVDDRYLHNLLGCVWPTKHRVWDAPQALPNDSKHNEAGFSTDSLCLRVAQMPRSRDLAIFVLTTDRQTNCFTPAAHARTRGNY
jgi:hypothetical protein